MRFLSGALVVAVLALAGPGTSVAAPKPSVVTLKTVKVGARGNPSVAIVPFTDAIYRSCEEAPQTKAGCQTVGGVGYGYRIGQLEVTVAQYVAFLNTADPRGVDRHHLYSSTESSTAWPRFGQIDFSSGAGRGRHYSVASPEWADKPYGFANFLRSARFVNSLYNGTLLAKRTAVDGAFAVTSYRVRLSRRTERGMYKMSDREMTRSHRAGFVVPSQNEWIKAAYYDPNGGGTYSYWEYPTNPGGFGDEGATAPQQSILDPSNGNVTNAGERAAGDLSRLRHDGAELVPDDPVRRSLRDRQPVRDPADRLRKGLPGQPQHSRPGADHLSLGHPRPGRQRGRVDRHDHSAAVRGQGAPGLATVARRHRQRARLPALALGGRTAAPGQHVLHRHLPMARHPRRRARQPEAGSLAVRFARC